MVGILAEDDQLDLVEGGVVQGREVFAAARVDDFPCLDLLLQEFTQVPHVGLGKLAKESCLPRGLEAHFVIAHGRRGRSRTRRNFRLRRAGSSLAAPALLPYGSEPHLLQIALAARAHRSSARTSASSRPRRAG